MSSKKSKKDLNLNKDGDLAAWEWKGGSLCRIVVWRRIQGHKGYRGPVFANLYDNMIHGIIVICIRIQGNSDQKVFSEKSVADVDAKS